MEVSYTRTELEGFVSYLQEPGIITFDRRYEELQTSARTTARTDRIWTLAGKNQPCDSKPARNRAQKGPGKYPYFLNKIFDQFEKKFPPWLWLPESGWRNYEALEAEAEIGSGRT